MMLGVQNEWGDELTTAINNETATQETPGPKGDEVSPQQNQEIIYISARPGWVAVNVREIWRFRELLYFLAQRDIKIRYKQTLLGAAWAVIQPLFTMVVFTVFFGKLAGIATDGIPKPLFYFAGLLPWHLFAYALTQSSNSIVTNDRLISKTYFPRLIVPLASVISGLVDFAIAFVVLLGLMAWYRYVPSWQIVYLPLFIAFAVLAALSVGLWFSALNVEYRDVRHVIPFLAQFWMFASPVVYPASLVQAKWGGWAVLYGLNPMVGILEGCRWAVFGEGQAPNLMTVLSLGVTVVLFVGGLFYFRRLEKNFADLV